MKIETTSLGGTGWMEDFAIAVQSASRHEHKFEQLLLLNGEALVPIEYLARIRFSDRKRIFGFHPYRHGMHEVEIYDRRITSFNVRSNAGRALLTLMAPIQELLEVVNTIKNLEDYIAKTFKDPETSGFLISKSVPDLNTLKDVNIRQAYHFHNPEIIGPFPYEQMVHPIRMARAILLGHGFFYSVDDIEPDDLHDANNRGTVWFTKDRQLVVKAFLGINDSRYETEIFSSDRYRGEVRFLTHKASGLITPNIFGKDDELMVIIMSHVVRRRDYYNLADMITRLPSDTWKGRELIVEWIDQWMKVLAKLQENSPKLWGDQYSLDKDLRHTEGQITWLSSRGYDMNIWQHALQVFRSYYQMYPSQEIG